MGRDPTKPPQPSKHIAERMGLWLKLFLLAVVPVYLIADFAIGTYREQDRKTENKAVCQARGDDAPVTILGKLHLFAQCADITELSFLGAKANVQVLLDETQERADADRATADLLAETQKRLTEMAALLEDQPAATEGVASLIAGLEGAETVLNQRLQTQEKVIEQLETKIDRPVTGNDVFLLVVGGDKSEADAVNQVKITRNILARTLSTDEARKLDVQFRLVGAWYRTVIVFDNREAARQTLARLNDVLPYGAYIRFQQDWCPDLAQKDDIQGVKTWRCVN